jgi:hypothetical protein
MGKIIKSPEALAPEDKNSIFLAGGISNCPDWQGPVAEILARDTDATIYNPRRENFDMNAYEDVSRQQIKWEYHALRLSHVNLFWFPCETLCPITLFELGSAIHRIHPGGLMVGTHPDYERRFDIIEQAKLFGNPISVFDSLDELVHETTLLLRNFDVLIKNP